MDSLEGFEWFDYEHPMVSRKDLRPAVWDTAVDLGCGTGEVICLSCTILLLIALPYGCIL